MEGGRSRSSRRATGSRARWSGCSPSARSSSCVPGVDGLIHISALSERRIAHPRDVVKVGEESRSRSRRSTRPRSASASAWWWTAPRWAAASRPRRQPPSPRGSSAPNGPGRPAPEGGPGGRRARWTASSPTACSWPSRAARASSRRARPGPSEAPTSKRHFQLGPGAEGGDPRDRRNREDPPLAHRGRARRRASGDGGVAAHPASVGRWRKGLRHPGRPPQGA